MLHSRKSQPILPCSLSLENHYSCYRKSDNKWRKYLKSWILANTQICSGLLGQLLPCSLCLPNSTAELMSCGITNISLCVYFHDCCLGMGLSVQWSMAKLLSVIGTFFRVLSIERHVRKLNGYISASLLTVQSRNECFLHICVVCKIHAQRNVSVTSTFWYQQFLDLRGADLFGAF